MVLEVHILVNTQLLSKRKTNVLKFENKQSDFIKIVFFCGC